MCAQIVMYDNKHKLCCNGGYAATLLYNIYRTLLYSIYATQMHMEIYFIILTILLLFSLQVKHLILHT